ncbi:uncharacterized protein BDV14DRAFT_199950 [Aspergillus stella-maris]|uniref:uncharacterized protein n=1 Tax=Aspergillus stella-maris TaxID=1810926 RepID=UPI003CCDB158
MAVILSPEQREALLDLPAGSPPPGQVSNLVDPPNLTVVGRVVLLSCFALACAFVAVRAYTKLFVMRAVRKSDYAILIAWAMFMGYFAPCWLGGEVSSGVDQWNLRLRDLRSLLWYYHVGSIVAGLIILFIKLAILLQLLEIFGHRRDLFFWSCHVVIWSNVIYYTVNTLLDIFGCRPIAKSWDFLITTGSCVVKTDSQNLSSSVINCASDLIILILPQTKIWQLHMSRRKKIAVSTVFAFGIMACTAAVVKLAFSVLIFKSTNNVSYYAFCMALSSLAEITCGILAACLPCTPSFAKRVRASPYVSKWERSLRSLLSARRSRDDSHANLASDARIQGNGGQPTKGNRVCADEYPLTLVESVYSSELASLGGDVQAPAVLPRV